MGYGPVIFFFLVVSFSGFGIRVTLALKTEFESVPTSSVLWTSLRTGINSLNVWWDSPGKLSELWFLGIFFDD